MFSAVIAIDKDFNIGKNGTIPWSCPEDLKHFKELTMGHVVIMGRKTYETIGKPLKGRINLIISKNMSLLDHKNVAIFKDPWDVVRHCNKEHKDKKWFVIGGAVIYDWFWSAKLIYDWHITHIDGSYPDCDTKFHINLHALEPISTTCLTKFVGDTASTINDTTRITNNPATDLVKTTASTINDTARITNNLTTDPAKVTAVYVHYHANNYEELQCLSVMKDLLEYGNTKLDRTGTGTKSLFGKQLRFDLSNNSFPLMTTRKMFIRGIFAELMLFIRGQTDSKILEDQKINIWKGNTSRQFLDSRGLNHLPVGDMGASYGFLFRHFGAKYIDCKTNYGTEGVDQLKNVINTIKSNPSDRRIIISLWDPTNLNSCPLPPCLYNYQFYVNGKELSCMMTQRSSDFIVAGGWNVATGALLTYLIATVCDLTPSELIWNIGDVHVYNNLIEQAKIQIKRLPKMYPKLFVKKRDNIEDFEYADLEMLSYVPDAAIEMVMNA